MKDRKLWKLFIICLMAIAILSVPMFVHANEVAAQKSAWLTDVFQIIRFVAEGILALFTIYLLYRNKVKIDENKGLIEELFSKASSHHDDLVKKLRDKERVCEDLEEEVYKLKKWKRYAIKADPDIDMKISRLVDDFIREDVNIARERYG